LLISDEITREGIIQKMRTRKLRDLAIDQGMIILWQNALAKVQRGVTTMDEVIRVVAVDQL
jgi:type IV pilus assembly protein PilB